MFISNTLLTSVHQEIVTSADSSVLFDGPHMFAKEIHRSLSSLLIYPSVSALSLALPRLYRAGNFLFSLLAKRSTLGPELGTNEGED